MAKTWCEDCKQGGVHGDPFEMDYLEFRCRVHGDRRAYVTTPGQIPEVRKQRSECLDFRKRRLTPERRALIYLLIWIVGAAVGGCFLRGDNLVLFEIIFPVGLLGIAWSIEGEMGNF